MTCDGEARDRKRSRGSLRDECAASTAVCLRCQKHLLCRRGSWTRPRLELVLDLTFDDLLDQLDRDHRSFPSLLVEDHGHPACVDDYERVRPVLLRRQCRHGVGDDRFDVLSGFTGVKLGIFAFSRQRRRPVGVCRRHPGGSVVSSPRESRNIEYAYGCTEYEEEEE